MRTLRLQGAKSPSANVKNAAKSVTGEWLKISTTALHKLVKETIIREGARLSLTKRIRQQKRRQQSGAP